MLQWRPVFSAHTFRCARDPDSSVCMGHVTSNEMVSGLPCETRPRHFHLLFLTEHI